MTYKRYKEALERIASAAGDPQEIAMEALRSRKPSPGMTMKKKENVAMRKLQFLLRAEDIHYRRAWGEPRKLLAREYGISIGRVAEIINQQRRAHERRYAKCFNCGHSGASHHNEKWEYSVGPCVECTCKAMEAGHD